MSQSFILGVRNEELSLLQKTLYCQSISISMAPTIPVISGIITFLTHVLGGGNLTAAQVRSKSIFSVALPIKFFKFKFIFLCQDILCSFYIRLNKRNFLCIQ